MRASPLGALGAVVSAVTVAARLVRDGADVAGRVLGGDLVEVAARGGRVDVARRGRLRDPVRHRGREAGARAAVDVVAHHTDVVASPPPRTASPSRPNRPPPASPAPRAPACPRPSPTPRSRPGRDCRPHPRRRPGRSRRPPPDGVAEARPRRLRDPVANDGVKPALVPAVHVVAHDTHVVARRTPRQRRRAQPTRHRQRPRRRRRRRIRIRDRGVHVGLDLVGGEGAVVDADFVDVALEPLAPDRVAADAQRARRRGERAGDRGAGRPGRR